MSVQLERWAGEFGDQYTQRNVVDWRDRIGAWWTMLKELDFEYVRPIGSDDVDYLEIGCNRGHNLRAIQALGGGRVAGIEPNREACREASSLILDHNVDVFPDIPAWESRARWLTRRAQVVFTCGVLIHVPPDELDATLRKIHTLSRKYILCIEYFAERETPVEYRGFTDMLWKRNWPQEYESRFPDLKLIRSGFWGKDSGFDSVHWWLYQKP